jgi:hypothetical protein
MIERKKIEEFWNWFAGIAKFLASDIENRSLIEDLDERMRALDPMLSWEIGPGSYELCQFVVSPNLDRDRRRNTQEIIALAPVIHGWEFHSARRPKDWDYKLVMERSEGQEPLRLDTSEWGFVLLRYPDGSKEVLLQGNNLSTLADDERWQAAAIALESILGEDVLLDEINDFELVEQLEPRFQEKRQPIQRLREAIVLA